VQLFGILVVLAILAALWLALHAVGLLISFIPAMILGLVVGAIASFITGSRHGILGDIVLGIFGSLLGGFLFSLVFHFRPANIIESLIVGIAGAVILLLIGKGISRPRRGYS
jgi:uncharacterized membrane protein YeaQ/YmgE (transglycosylase-associated protein family)